jgi:exodeoxyribonuclease VII large subunit
LAAGVVVPDRDGLEAELSGLRALAQGMVVRRLEMADRRLAAVDTGASARAGLAVAGTRLIRAGDQLRLLHPRRQLAEAERLLTAVDWVGPAARRVAQASGRLAAVGWRRPLANRLAAAADRVAADRRHLTALSPERVLERGYAVARRGDGTVLRRADQVAAGEPVDVRLATGRLSARVEEVHDE